MQNKHSKKIEKIVLGGGCFWCIEAVYKGIDGVIDVVSGYSGGTTIDPTYDDVCSGETGHVEVVQITFESNVVSLLEILEIFFKVHDPTSIDRQGNDIGSQYRSVIFYIKKDQNIIAKNFIDQLRSIYQKDIVTEVKTVEQIL